MLLRRLLGSRLAGIREVAHEVLDGLDDRSRLFALELATERQRLTRLVVAVVATLVVAVIALVWAAATAVALAWDTPWRHLTLLALLAFWIIGAVALGLWARALARERDSAFRLSRQVVTEDVARLREALR
jgi:uncharacterized membrane protein YqjE